MIAASAVTGVASSLLSPSSRRRCAPSAGGLELIDAIARGSPPISLGSVPQSERVFVNQEHPDGRITFIDWNTSEARTVTGFELNSRIQD